MSLERGASPCSDSESRFGLGAFVRQMNLGLDVRDRCRYQELAIGVQDEERRAASLHRTLTWTRSAGLGYSETNNHISGTSALHPAPEESAHHRRHGFAPGAEIGLWYDSVIARNATNHKNIGSCSGPFQMGGCSALPKRANGTTVSI
jgi:hypothetical protein